MGQLIKMKQKKDLIILGSTGSIGQSTLNVVRRMPEQFAVKALVAKQNIDLLEKQARQFSPDIIAVYDEKKSKELKQRLPATKIVSGLEGILEVLSFFKPSLCVSALSGTIGIQPTLHAITCGHDIALANKEALVSAGELVRKFAKNHNVQILPIDSEQSAIFQCLQGENQKAVHKLILTASGGPFFKTDKKKLSQVLVADALKHPTWSMGVKNTIDSSTLMNKGLEVIEAHYLFDVLPENIDVTIHPQSLVHSFVEFVDGSLLAQVAPNDMELPIQYALTYPERKACLSERFDFKTAFQLDFHPPDMDKFLCLKLALEGLFVGKSMPCFMNAANEILVNRFVKGQISWLDIGKKLETLMANHKPVCLEDSELIGQIDALGRSLAESI